MIPDAIDLVRKAAGKVVSDPAQVLQAQPGMGGEDFSEYTVLGKGCLCPSGVPAENTQPQRLCSL